MTDHELTDLYQAPEDYRGSLVYTQEYGYKTVTMIVSVAPDEQSYVTNHAHNLPVTEGAKHLQGVEFYHFAVTDGAQVQLTFEAPAGNTEVWYNSIVVEPSPIDKDDEPIQRVQVDRWEDVLFLNGSPALSVRVRKDNTVEMHTAATNLMNPGYYFPC